MHELLDAIALLFDLLLMPFSQGSEPRSKWVKALGLLIAAVGVLAFFGVLAWMYLAPTEGILS